MKDFENTKIEIKELSRRVEALTNNEYYLHLMVMRYDEEYDKEILGNYLHEIEIIIYIIEDLMSKTEKTDDIDLNKMTTFMDSVTDSYIYMKKLYDTL